VAGAWPQQSPREHAADLLLDRPGSNHSPLAALLRICSGRILHASSLAIRGGYPVVCFTAADLSQLSQLTRYQRHRVRWDFLRYGLCIDRGWLRERGARPVLYGDRSAWSALAAERRPYFQLIRGRTQAANADDWSREQEWRILGDVDLSALPAERACVFVPTAAEGRVVSFVSRWPVMVLE
jgi:hypothetical protein